MTPTAEILAPFKDGDRINGDWDRYGLCPVCGKYYKMGCKCPERHMVCPDGHEWHTNWPEGIVVVDTVIQEE